MGRFELPTSPLPRECSTPELHGRIMFGAGEGNRTLTVSLEGFCSTIELHPQTYCINAPTHWNLVVGEGFEPSKLSQQIYSLPPLTARESHQKKTQVYSRLRFSSSSFLILFFKNHSIYCFKKEFI